MNSTIQPPPRLLLGATLLFWGAMTDNPLLGLVLALIVEGSNWIRFRWDFGDQACALAWRICLTLITITGVLIWLDGNRYTALPKLMVWFPALFLPLQFVQSFGLRKWIPVNSLSFFSKLHRKRNIRLGLESSVLRFNFGNVYFVIIIVAAGLGRFAQHTIFLPGIVILAGCLAFARLRTRVFAFLFILILGGAIGLGGQIGMSKFYRWATNRSGSMGGFPSTDPTVNRTSIGSLGELKQSPDMLWRLMPQTGQAPPRLLRTASYNRYRGIVWKNNLPDQPNEEDKIFNELSTIELTEGEPYYLVRDTITPAELSIQLPEYSMRGASRSEEPIPLPGNAASLQKFELDGIEANPLGTIRVFPKRSIIEGRVRWKDSGNPEDPPFPTQDLEIDEVEEPAIRQIAQDLGLAELSTTTEKINRLRKFFTSEFEYTRYLSIRRPRASRNRPTPIETFLTSEKRGHCEYFATAASLLLRASDVPTRYCVGFSVMERHPKRNEWVVRGTHGHAWVRVWDAEQEKWIDFDPTPSGWLAAELGEDTWTRQLADSYQRFKEDFFLWRNRPANRIGSLIVMWLLGLSVLIFVGKRLWKSKVLVDTKTHTTYGSEQPTKTPLHELEKTAAKLLGPRTTGETFVSWLWRLKSMGVSETSLKLATSLHQRLRFDPNPPKPEALEELKKLVTDIRKQLTTS
ncbi:MAG: transglutaminase family protein [Akkermansiaceae bacterium]